MAGIIVRDDGRALVNSFVIPNHRGDLDVDTVTDAVELWTNEIQFVLLGGPGCIPWLCVDPLEATAGPGNTADHIVTVNSADLDPGIYNANIVIEHNITGLSPVEVPVTLTVLAPDIVVVPDSFEVTLDRDMQETADLMVGNLGPGTLVFNIDIDFLGGASVGSQSAQIQIDEQAVVTLSKSNQGAVDEVTVASYTLGTLTEGPSILVYTDDYVEQALIALGLPATVFYGDYDGFGAALGAGPSALAVWDLVIVSHNNFFELGNYWVELEAYYNGGGKLLIETFDIDGSNSEPTTLWDTLGVQQILDQGTPEPLYKWDEGHPVFTSPEAVPDMTSPQDDYIDDGDRTEPGAGSSAIAGFSPEGTVLVEQVPNMAGIIVKDDGTALVNSFVISNHRGDLDGDTSTDAIELWTNEIQFMLTGASIWLSVAPDEGSVGPGGTADLVVTFNSANLDPGTYNANIVIDSNDPDGVTSASQVLVPATLHVLAPQIGVDPLIFDLVLDRDACGTADLTITNLGPGTLAFEILGVPGLVSANPATGTILPGDNAVVEMTFCAPDLPPGVNVVQFDVESNDPVNPAVTVTVNIDVPPPDIGVDPLVIDVVLDRDEGTSDQITISNGGPGTLAFDIEIVDTTPAPAGSADISPDAPPANDDFPGTTVTESPFTDAQDTTDATFEPGEPDPGCGSSIGKTVWYGVTPSGDGLLAADTFGSNFDTILAAYTGPDLGSLTLVQCNDDASGLQSQISFAGTAGQTYYFQVGGYSGQTGNLLFNLDVAGGVGGGGLSWVSVDPDSGLVAPAGDQVVAVNFDSTDLEPGVYTADILINSNDPGVLDAGVDSQPVVVQVSLTVIPPQITVDPLSFDKTMDRDQQAAETLDVGNLGPGPCPSKSRW